MLLTGTLMVPVFGLFTLFDTLRLQNILSISRTPYEIITIIFLVSLISAYIIPVIYWNIKRKWWALGGSAVGGLVICFLLFAVQIYIYCVQGTCF